MAWDYQADESGCIRSRLFHTCRRETASAGNRCRTQNGNLSVPVSSEWSPVCYALHAWVLKPRAVLSAQLHFLLLLRKFSVLQLFVSLVICFFSYQWSSVFHLAVFFTFRQLNFLLLFSFVYEFFSLSSVISVFSILLRLSSAQQPALEQNEEIRSENWELHCSFAFQYWTKFNIKWSSVCWRLSMKCSLACNKPCNYAFLLRVFDSSYKIIRLLSPYLSKCSSLISAFISPSLSQYVSNRSYSYPSYQIPW